MTIVPAKLHHVSRQTQKLDETRRFYVEVLGFRELSSRQLSPAFGSLSDIAETEEQLPDFIQRETGLTRPLDNREPIKHRGVVTSLSADSLGGKEYSNPLVVAYGGRLKSDLSRNLGNR